MLVGRNKDGARVPKAREMLIDPHTEDKKGNECKENSEWAHCFYFVRLGSKKNCEKQAESIIMKLTGTRHRAVE